MEPRPAPTEGPASDEILLSPERNLHMSPTHTRQPNPIRRDVNLSKLFEAQDILDRRYKVIKYFLF